MPTVSILLPVYNGTDFLDRALTSLARQTFRDFEVIAIDDHSSDATSEVLAAFAKDHPFLTFHRNPVNLRLPGTVNRAAQFATGKYVCMFNHDDELEDTYLERLTSVALTEDADLVWSDLLEIDADGVPSGKSHLDSWRSFIFAQPVTTFAPEQLLPEILRRRYYPFMVTGLIRRSLFEKVGGMHPAFVPCSDAQLFTSLLLVSRKIVYVNEPLFRYRRTSDNMTAKTWKSRQMPDEMEYIFLRHLRPISRFAEQPKRFRHSTYKDCLKRLLSATKHRRYPVANYWKLLLARTPQAL